MLRLFFSFFLISRRQIDIIWKPRTVKYVFTALQKMNYYSVLLDHMASGSDYTIKSGSLKEKRVEVIFGVTFCV